MNKKDKKQSFRKPELYKIAEIAALVIAEETGVSFAGICSQTKRSNFYKARVLFSGILSSYGIHLGKIAQITYKKKEVIEEYVTEYNRKIKTLEEFQQIAKNVESSINN
jgi:hypothetical protein